MWLGKCKEMRRKYKISSSCLNFSSTIGRLQAWEWRLRQVSRTKLSTHDRSFPFGLSFFIPFCIIVLQELKLMKAQSYMDPLTPCPFLHTGGCCFAPFCWTWHIFPAMVREQIPALRGGWLGKHCQEARLDWEFIHSWMFWLLKTFQEINDFSCQFAVSGTQSCHHIAIFFAGGEEGQHSRESPEEPNAPRK